MDTEPSDDVDLDLGTLARRMTVGIVGLLVVVGVLALTVREPLTAASAWFVDNFGLLGLAAGVFVLDAVPFTTHEPLLFFAYEGGIPFWTVFAVAGTASTASSLLGYSLGTLLGTLPAVRRMMRRYRLEAFLHRYGFWAIAMSATLPFPYAIATWGCGAARTPLGPMLVGALFRYPKVLFYLSLMAGVWGAVGA